jgi:BASS family bile acid:Na+ symporter
MLALALALVSLGTGLALSTADLRLPRGWIVAVVQVVAAPLLTWLLGLALGWPAPVIAGLMLVAAAPGALPAQVLAAVAGGDVPLARAVTAAGTALSVVTLPALAGGLPGPGFAGPMVLLVGLPFLAGLALRRIRPALAARAEGLAATAASLATAGLVLAALWQGGLWQGGAWGPALSSAVVLALLLSGLGRLASGFLRVGSGQGVTLTLALPLRNVAVPLSLALGAGRPDWALPAACYALAMYAVALALVALRLREGRPRP